MAFNFTPETPVLNFGRRIPKEHGRWKGREYILWPAWSYRVVAPRTQDRQLNMFQRAILGLCRIGTRSAKEIGDKLAIHPDLAAFILAELTNLGFLDAYGVATDKGVRALTDDSIDSHEMIAGYVFQDPRKGDLWPRFVENLDYCDLEFEDSGFPRLLLGTAGNPKRFNAFMVLPGDLPEPGQPSPSSIVAAVRTQSRRMRFADQFAEPDEEWDSNDPSLTSASVQRVSFIDEEPKPVFLTTYLYMPESAAAGGDWYARDPFGLGASARLRRRVEEEMQNSNALHTVVNRLVGRGIHEGLDEQRQWLSQLRTAAELEVENNLSTNVREYAAFPQIVEMEFAHQEASLLGRECPKSKLDDVLRRCLKCLEAVFAGLCNQYPLGDIWTRVYVDRSSHQGGRRLVPQRDKAMLSATYQAAALDVGFAEPIPETLMHVTPGQIRSVAEFGDHWRLRPTVVACILAAQSDSTHQLIEVARVVPEVLNDIDEIASLGGMAGHAGESTASLSNTESAVVLTYKIISSFLGLSSKNDQASAQGGETRNG